MEKQGAINQYRCQKCQGVITTINAVDGVTPGFVLCKAKDCHGLMISAFYHVPPYAVPHWEWYRPEGKELERLIRESADWKDHVANGGLNLRKLTGEPAKRRGPRKRKKKGIWAPGGDIH